MARRQSAANSRSEDTRSRILAGAERVFLDAGEAGLTMRAVASASGVGTMTSYRHFENRDALLAALVDRGFARFQDYFSRAMNEVTADARLARCAALYLDFALDHPRFYALMFSGPHLRGLPMDEGARERVAASLAFLVARIGDAHPELSPAAAERRARSLWAHAHGLVSLHVSRRLDDDEHDFRALYDDAMRAHLAGLEGRPQGETAR